MDFHSISEISNFIASIMTILGISGFFTMNYFKHDWKIPKVVTDIFSYSVRTAYFFLSLGVIALLYTGIEKAVEYFIFYVISIAFRSIYIDYHDLVLSLVDIISKLITFIIFVIPITRASFLSIYKQSLEPWKKLIGRTNKNITDP